MTIPTYPFKTYLRLFVQSITPKALYYRAFFFFKVIVEPDRKLHRVCSTLGSLPKFVELGSVLLRRWRRGNDLPRRIEPLPSSGVVVGKLDGV